MAASIAHEINQPLGAVVNSASASLRWLDAHKPEEARRSISRVIAEGHRASEIIGRIRALVKKTPSRKDWLDINETIHEDIALVQSGVQRNGVALGTELSDDVPLILADRVQLQQVILNLMMNAIEAMWAAGSGPRELLFRSGTDESQNVLVSVRDSGPGLAPKALDRLFDAFYTTKPQGDGHGTGDQPVAYRGPRRAPMGQHKSATRRRISVHRADWRREPIMTEADATVGPITKARPGLTFKGLYPSDLAEKHRK